MTYKNDFVKNTALLFISMLITKIVGALFKIPLTNIIGGVGMGYYSTAYSLYSPVFAVTAAAVPTVIVKAVASSCRYSDNIHLGRVIKTAIILFGGIGLTGTVLMLAVCKPFAHFVAGSPESFICIALISPSVLICCISAIFKGYYEGVCNMGPSAFSNILEAVSRAVFGLSASYIAISYGMDCYNKGLPIFGKIALSDTKAMEYILPYAAAGAVLAVTISEFVSLICLTIKFRTDKTRPPIRLFKPKDYSFKAIAKKLISDSIPIALGMVAVNLYSFIDLITVPRCIGFAIYDNAAYFTDTMGNIIKEQGGSLRLSGFLYGSYTGVATTVFMLIPSFTAGFGRSALPEIAGSYARGDKKSFNKRLSVVLKSNFLLGFPLYMGLAALCEPVLYLLYSSRPGEAGVSVLPLFILCIGGIFYTLAGTFFGVLQVIDRGDIPIKLTLISAAIKLILNVFLITLPEINITGAALSTVVSQGAAALLGYLAIENVTRSEFNILKSMASPLISGILCAITAYIVYSNTALLDNSVIRLAISVLAGGIVYIISVTLTGGLPVKRLFKRKSLKKSPVYLKNP